MTRLSVNINKVATLRNARGGNVPNVVKVALDCESFGADGITVHPRPDERHIRKSDVYDLRPLLRTEFNIEGYPAPEFIDLDCTSFLPVLLFPVLSSILSPTPTETKIDMNHGRCFGPRHHIACSHETQLALWLFHAHPIPHPHPLFYFAFWL